MSRYKNIGTLWGRIRGKRGSRHPARRRARPALEDLECRLCLSVGGGWISSTQHGQSGDGFFGQYYNNSALLGTPSFTRWDDRVDFDSPHNNASPGGSPDPAFASVGPSNWSAKWTGILTANFSETYTFRINSAGNGVRLWVTPVGQQQGNPIINDWTNHSQKTDTATMTLQAGQDYAVELDFSQTSASVQQVQLQWSSPSTPMEDIETATQVGLNVDGGDALFANMVNARPGDAWWVAGNTSLTVPTDSNFWPQADAEILLGNGDATTQAGGSYLVQFTGMATVSNSPQNVDWWVNGTDLQSSTLQAGQGYNSSTNTTTATMVLSPGPDSGFYLTFINTSRDPNPPLNITAISYGGATVTVSVPSVSGIATNQNVTIAGYTGSAANYNGTFAISGVNKSNNTFTYVDQFTHQPGSASGGTAILNPENGITNLYVMQPSTLGGNTPLPAGTLFTTAAVSELDQYTVLRLMWLNNTPENLTSNWSDRTLVSDNFWSGYTFNSGTGVDTGVAGATPYAGVPWEIQVALANETGKDVYINVPTNVSVSYLTNLANLFAYGSNGVTPYTSVQSNPVWKPLNANLKVYIEFSNETWNSGYVVSETFSDGWANQLSQRALYDYLTNNQADPLYPGGGSNAYNDGAILDAYLVATRNFNSSNASAFLSTYNADPAPSMWGSSPEYFSNTASTAIEGYGLGVYWVGLRDVQISNAFKTAFGETNVNAVDTSSRVRPVFEWQYGGDWAQALPFISEMYGAQHPVSYYLYGGGGGWYADNTVGGFSDVSFANPAFANGLTGWSASGSAGVVANGSSMGNLDAPPLFSAIAITNGATELGNRVTITTTTTHNFVAGQSVTVAGVTDSGYNGAFTITSVTPTTFTYLDSATGLANSGDGIVAGNGSSTQTAYLGPGASLSQNVTFSGGYADITLYASQSVASSLSGYQGLTITLTPTNGGPAINNGQPILESEGAPYYSDVQNAFIWARTEAFYTGASDYTYTVTFTSTLPSGTVFFDNVAIQTVNGMFNETTAAVQSTLLNISSDIESDVNLAAQYGLHDVGYEGGYYFAGGMSTGGYLGVVWAEYSSPVPNVGAYANIDPRAEQLAIDTFDQFYAAGGTLPIVFESSANTNSWAVASPTYFDFDTPKQQAAASVEDPPSATANFVKQDTTTQGNWIGAYGSQGYNIVGDAASYPSYATVTAAGQSSYTWAASTTDPRGLENPGGTGRLAETWYTTSNFTINVDLTDGRTHDVALYAVDWSGSGRTEQIRIASAATGAVLDTETLSNFTGGAYLQWELSGNVVITITSVSGSAVVSGLFFDPSTAPIIKYQPSIAWVAPGPIIYGTMLGSSQLDASANVAGTFSYTPAAGAILGAGINTLSVTFTPTDTIDYATATATATINVLRATPTISWSAPANIIYGTALSGTQLDATANMAGTFAYAPASGTVLKTGNSQTLSATFTPTDTIDYTTATATATINVLRATPTISWSAPANIIYGTALSGTQLDATANMAGTFAYAPASGTVLKTGNSQTLSATFTPTDTIDYTTATVTATINVLRATPTISWSAPANIIYGTALSGTQLDATANMAGTFAYAPASGTVLKTGNSQTLSATFTPTDTIDYTTATGTATINVLRATPTISWSAPANIVYGTALSGTQLDATANMAGTFAYAPASGTVLKTGNSQTLSATFTPTDTIDYTTATSMAAINVEQAAPTISWSNPANIVYGTALSGTQLDATANTAGTFAYAPASGTVMKAGNSQTLKVTFTPADASDYTTATAMATINVTRAAPQVGVSDGGGMYKGSSFAATVTLAGIGGAPGASLEGVGPVLTYYAGSTAAGTPLSGPPTAVGSYTVVASFPGSADYASASSLPSTFNVAAATATVALESSTGSTVSGQSVTLTATVSLNGPGAGTPTGTVTFFDGTAALAKLPLDASGQATLTIGSLSLGSHTITAVETGDGSSAGGQSGVVSESVSSADTQILLVPHAVLKRKKIATLNLTAQVEPLAPGGGIPTGTVTFMMKKKTLATTALSDGQATVTVKAGSILNQLITVVYGGATGYRPSALASRSLTTRSLAGFAPASLKRLMARLSVGRSHTGIPSAAMMHH